MLGRTLFKALVAGFALLIVLIGLKFFMLNQKPDKKFIKGYADMAYILYGNTLKDAKKMQYIINEFVKDPTNENLMKAKHSWLNARKSYSRTEVFRFYGGPIDFSDKTGYFKDSIYGEGPEGRLNSWPVDESYMDYVQGAEKSGLINDLDFDISRDTLLNTHQSDDEAKVLVGYHAIEFLLWGQDLSLDSAGKRPVSDYSLDNEVAQRRAKYLQIITDILVEDLEYIYEEWTPNKNYYAFLLKMEKEEFIEKILSSFMTLVAFEVASERLGSALDSGDQEDEQSCFSDNTSNDFFNNMVGLRSVFEGKVYGYGKKGDLTLPAFYHLLSPYNKELSVELSQEIRRAHYAASKLPAPFDREVLASKDPAVRKQVEDFIVLLNVIAGKLKVLGNQIGVEVEVMND